jgi:hypothetical protein
MIKWFLIGNVVDKTYITSKLFYICSLIFPLRESLKVFRIANAGAAHLRANNCLVVQH